MMVIGKEEDDYSLSTYSNVFEFPGVTGFENIAAPTNLTHARTISSETNSSVEQFQYPPRTHASLNGYPPRRVESYIPMEAPTQNRRYITPSATSRKTLPKYVQIRRRAKSASDEEDELEEQEPLREGATDQEKIDFKRRQNTLSARRSRRRRASHLRQLEDAVEELKIDRDIWKERTYMLSRLLTNHGIPSPNFDR